MEEFKGVDPDLFAKGRSDIDLSMLTTPYGAHDVTLKTRRRHTQPASSLNNHKKIFREKKLRLAASYNDVEKIAHILTEGDVDPNSADEQGRTALHIAASRGYADVVQTLIQAGANANAEDKLGNTPMHLAVYTPSIETVSHLLKGGCRLRKTSSLPYTPLELAQSKYLILEKQQNCVLPRTQVFRIITLLRRAIEADLFNKLTSEIRKQEVEALLKGLADIELTDSADTKPAEMSVT